MQLDPLSQDLLRPFEVPNLDGLGLQTIFLSGWLTTPWQSQTGIFTWIKSGTKEWSWKYNSILSPNVSRAVGPNMYGPRILFVASNGVKMVYFSFIFALILQIYSVNGER